MPFIFCLENHQFLVVSRIASSFIHTSGHASDRNEPPAFQETLIFNPSFSYFMFVLVFSPI